VRRQKSNLNNLSLPSRVDHLLWEDQTVYIKRDDLISPLLSGNKYRKLYYYLQENLEHYSKVVSYGGIQSNAMLSMAALADEKKVPFIYYTRYIPKNLPKDMKSNYTQALDLGMQVKVMNVISDEEIRSSLLEIKDENTLLIVQGGATKEAQYGIEILAQEIIKWKEKAAIDELVVATPSGTGTTALWLQQYLAQEGIDVVTTPVVGDSQYLKQQMQRTASNMSLPRIITTQKHYPFAKPDLTLYEHYQYFLDKGIAFDLIYSGVMWQALKENLTLFKGKTILYVHSGGVMGNVSQLQRYEKLFH